MKFYLTSFAIESPHAQYEIISFANAVLDLSPELEGCIVEAGCFKGGSAAKFSLIAEKLGRPLIVFDSFQGLPDHNENMRSKGSYRGTLSEVRQNIASYGCLKSCEFVEGWFEETMPRFSLPIAAIFLDVDLATSTRTCLKHLYPLLAPNGVLYSHDGRLSAVVDVFGSRTF